MSTCPTVGSTSWRADRLGELPPYLFVEIDRKKALAKAAGRDVIDFGVGDPDMPTPAFIVDRMADAIREASCHRYSPAIGRRDLREAVCRYFVDRFGVDLDPDTEVLALIGSKEGIGNLPTAVINPGDVVLVPEPGYPVYTAGTVFAEGACHTMPLSESRGWLPALGEIPADVARRARLMYLNYPNNPTSACATKSFFEEAVAFAREHEILIAHDAAYVDVYFSDPPPSILEVDGAKDVCIEFHSLSKTFNMTGWRIAFAVGHAAALSALAKVKANLDSGPFGATQLAAIAALDGRTSPPVREQVEVYRRRRDILVGGLRKAGWSVRDPEATFYLWTSCPPGSDSMSTASRILDEADVVTIPGSGFGACGEGFIRFALTVDEERTAEAMQRLARLTW